MPGRGVAAAAHPEPDDRRQRATSRTPRSRGCGRRSAPRADDGLRPPARWRPRRTAARPCAGSRGSASAGGETLARTRMNPSTPVHHHVGALHDRHAAPPPTARPTRDGGVEHALADQRLECLERVEVGGVVAAESAVRGARRSRGRASRGPCRSAHRRPHLEHLAPPVRRRSRPPPPPARVPRAVPCAASSSGTPRQWNATIGPLSSIRTRSSRSSGVSRSSAKRLHAPLPALEGRDHPRARLSRLEQLGAVRAGVGDPADPHEPPRLGGGAPGDAGDAAVAPRQARRGAPRPPRAPAPSSARCDDRRERAVHVAEDAARAAPPGAGAAPPRARLRWERTPAVVCPAMSSRLVRLAAIATAAGAFRARSVRRRRRDRDGAAARDLARLRAARGHRHLAGGDRGDRGPGRDRPGVLRERATS